MGTAEHEVAIGTTQARLTELGPSVLTYAGQGVPDVPNPDPPISANAAVSLSNPQLSPADGRWLREALDVVPHPVVALPLNDIALGVSPDLGMSIGGTPIAGVSFSQIGDSSGYHTDLDNPDRVSAGFVLLGLVDSVPALIAASAATGFANGLFNPAVAADTRAWAVRAYHTHETWLVEDQVPRVLRLQRLGHKRKDIDDFYSHVTPAICEKMLAALQERWDRCGWPGRGPTPR